MGVDFFANLWALLLDRTYGTNETYMGLIDEARGRHKAAGNRVRRYDHTRLPAPRF